MKSVVPIALFAYARPDHLQKTLEGLKRNRIPLVYAFSDGPRGKGKEPPVNQVRKLLRGIDWCEVRLIEREKNLGLGGSIRDGITEVLRHNDRIIVIEDDIVLRPGAYDYAVGALDQYENDPRVMTISMWNHPSLVPRDSPDGYFSKRFVCWGWATYRWAWQKYAGTPLDTYNQCKRERIDVLSWGNDLRWQAEHAEERNLWYVGYALTHFLFNKVSFFPAETLAINIGRDLTGENMSGGVRDDISKLDSPVDIPSVWPDVEIKPGLEMRFASYFESKSVPIWRRPRIIGGRIKRQIKKFMKTKS